ncbi:MAG: endolytic transglycosylase MltG [Treponema sp.]|nr:endolytic transglycosylase MltG [Treponema sp.]
MAGKRKKKFSIISSFLKLISFMLALALIVIPLTLIVFMYFNSPVNDNGQIIISEYDGIRYSDDGNFLIDIRRGETSQSVGLRLERAGLINNRYFWNLLCRYFEEHIKTGTYKLELPATPIAIHSLLVSGREILHKVTIPEGVTLNKTALILEQAGICSAVSFLAAARDRGIINDYGIPNESMEGYLFPDTYFFPSEYPAEKTVRKMADNFFNKLDIISPAIRGMSVQELNEKVILASIVEREYRVADEAPVMAGVFANRLRINMRLQSCATVEYIITEIQGKPHPRVLLYVDLEIRNPYNTYLYSGLPPGPISAPGMVALRAVIYPANTDFLYFRLTDVSSGRHYFSRTHDEHIRAGELLVKPPS